MKSFDSCCFHRPWPILLWIVRASLLTIKYRVVQFLPNTSILEQFESMYLTILQQILSILLWSGGHRCMEWILCRVVESSCWLTHNIVPHISLHDQSCHKTMKKCEDFERMVISLFTRWISRFEHGSVIVHSIFACFASSLSADQVYMIQERCWFTQIDFFVKCFPHRIKILFLSSQFLCHPHAQIRITLFDDVQRDIPNLNFSPSHASIGSSQIAFPITVLPKDDHTDFAQEERPDLPYWTMISPICVVVDESECLGTPIWEFSIICEHLPFSLGHTPILRLLLVHRNPAIWNWYPWSRPLSF